MRSCLKGGKDLKVGLMVGLVSLTTLERDFLKEEIAEVESARYLRSE